MSRTYEELFRGFFYRIIVRTGGVVARVLAHDTKGRGFESRPFHVQVTTLGKLFTHVPLPPSSIIWYRSSGGDALRLGR